MKYFLLVIFIIAIKSSIGQSSTESDIRKLAGFYIGDSLDNVKESIICADASYLNSLYSDNSKCRSFRYLPIQIDSLTIEKVKFGTLILGVDSNKRIKNLTLHKSYVSTDLISRAQESNEDLIILNQFFNDLFRLSGIKKTNRDKYYLQKKYKWKIENNTIVLNQTNFKRKKNGKKLTIIDIFIE